MNPDQLRRNLGITTGCGCGWGGGNGGSEDRDGPHAMDDALEAGDRRLRYHVQ
jgi:hypothetical protein